VRLATALVVVGGCAWVVASVGRLVGVRVNVSPSLPMGVYRVTGARVKEGALVEVCLPTQVGAWAVARGYLWRGGCAGGAAALGKRVVGWVGDTVEVRDDGVYVDGARLVGSRPLECDTKGRPLPRWRGRVVLRRGEMWLAGTASARSFDSRYFGAVSRAAVVAVLVPVWTAR
jgi:conjugative transfer signal peptidase TraF